jgi:hypothetical protein
VDSCRHHPILSGPRSGQRVELDSNPVGC